MTGLLVAGSADVEQAVAAEQARTAQLVEQRKREWAARVAVYPVLGRVLADSRDRVGWAKARDRTIGASDAAKFSKLSSAPGYAKTKMFSPFHGNDFTAHGNDREPAILAAFNLEQNFLLFHAEGNPRHTATPDGIKLGGDGSILLAEVKTTNKPWRTIPLGYRRQVWWAQYVLGADRTLFGWEVHENYQPVDMEPESVFIDRDDTEIAKMVEIADAVLEIIDAGDNFENEMLLREGTE